MWSQIRSREVSRVLFAEVPPRSALERLGRSSTVGRSPQRVQVWRNHLFEGVGRLASLFSSYFDEDLKFTVGAYDDSFSFGSWMPHDLELIWIDPTRYEEKMGPTDFVDWLAGRVIALRDKTTAPILAVSWGLDAENSALIMSLFDRVGGAIYVDASNQSFVTSNGFLDERLVEISGTKISAKSQVLIARALALKWIPAFLNPPLKAIVIDLDNTLYSGVLGEDGANRVLCTGGHRQLHQSLKTLSEKGIFLAISSKNLEQDVIDFWGARTDLGIELDDFALRIINWAPKSEAVSEVCSHLRIAPQSVLFVDDNPGELFEVSKSFPHCQLILADEDPRLTERMIEFYPGVFQWGSSVDSRFRVDDLKANIAREEILSSSGREIDYFRDLRVELGLFQDREEHVDRGFELIRKTNQFNLSLARTPESEILKAVHDPLRSFVTMSLRDRLSDSGIVGVLVSRFEGDSIVVDELCISCRALGRGLEETMVMESLKLAAGNSVVRVVRIKATPGERNLPAIETISKLAGKVTPDGSTEISAEIVRLFTPPSGILLGRG